MLNLPETPSAFASSLHSFRETLVGVKRNLAPPQPGWYPYDSFTGIEIGLQLMRPLYREFTLAVNSKPVADVGCGDGDLALLFASWGGEVDAIDNPPTNYNRMQGVERLAHTLSASVTCFPLDLDSRFEWPRRYGIALFLNALYHLQNPYYALERLAFHADWCLLSTRIAQRTVVTGIRIAEEPLAYLASGIEISGDATNYWVFSLTGLLRILQRTRWAIRGIHHAGCLTDSNPSSPDADERVFLLLQSRVSYPALQVRPALGWHLSEEHSFRWTSKHFTLEIVLPLEQHVSGFTLALYIPEALLPHVTLHAWIEERSCGSAHFTEAGAHSFQGVFPITALHYPVLTLAFTVESAFAGDGRDLGICVPFENGKPALEVF